MSTPQFNSYINEKYVDPSGVHHYEIEQTSGNTKTKIEVTDLTNYPNGQPL